MSKASSNGFDFTVPSALKRFSALNRDRIQRVHEVLSARQADFLDVLPLLFHFNHPLLPGYVGGEAAHGIADYAPSAKCLQAARRLCRSFEFDRRHPPRFAVRGLYMMGSPGSIAYSRKSDLDMWLVHDKALKPADVESLADRASRIERYAESIGLEVHFFVFDAERFRSGETLSLSDESSGSSQHSVLLDEFYRSSVLLAGLPPLWWRVPSCYDNAYAAYTAEAFKRLAADPRDYIDFGGLSEIPAEEFFGAAVWQLYKSIDSPYKSVLKLLLMEAYSAEFPHMNLLCTRFKQGLEAEHADLEALDPYILMYTKVEEYLMARNDAARLEVMRRSFYLKSNVRVGTFDPERDDDWRAAMVHRLTEAWGWSKGRRALLDDRSNWRLPVAIEARRDVTRTLREAYAYLSRFARNHAAELKISERDLHVLGRKLYAAFERKPAKIEIVTRGICDAPFEPQLSLHEVAEQDGRPSWRLFNGLVRPAEIGLNRPMKRGASPVELVWWCHLNRLANHNTSWHVFADSPTFSGHDVRRLQGLLAEESRELDHGVDTAALAAQPRITNAMLFVNVGVDPLAGIVSDGDVLTTSHTDPLQFGGRRINLVRTVDLLIETSWHEAFAYRFSGSAAALQATAECFTWFNGDVPEKPHFISNCYGADHAATISERVETLVGGSYAALAHGRRERIVHVIVETDGHIHRLTRGDGAPALERHADCAALIRALGQVDGPDLFNEVHFDEGCARSALLASIYRHNRPGSLQIFARPHGDRADIYLVTETGALLVQRQEYHALDDLFEHYQRFLHSTHARGITFTRDGEALKIECIEIDPTPQRIRLVRHAPRKRHDRAYLPLRVLADVGHDDHQQLTFIVAEREFSTIEHGPSVFAQVAEFVLAQRHKGNDYPIYITDLDLSTAFRRAHAIEHLTSHKLLSLKKRIEYQLTRALHRDLQSHLLPLAS